MDKTTIRVWISTFLTLSLFVTSLKGNVDPVTINKINAGFDTAIKGIQAGKEFAEKGGNFASIAGKLSKSLGAIGGLVSFALAFLGGDSPELQKVETAGKKIEQA